MNFTDNALYTRVYQIKAHVPAVLTVNVAPVEWLEGVPHSLTVQWHVSAIPTPGVCERWDATEAVAYGGSFQTSPGILDWESPSALFMKVLGHVPMEVTADWDRLLLVTDLTYPRPHGGFASAPTVTNHPQENKND